MGEGEVEVYREGNFLIKFSTLTAIEDRLFPVSVTFLGCTERLCLFPYTQTFSLPLAQVDSSPVRSLDAEDSAEDADNVSSPRTSDKAIEGKPLSLTEQVAGGALSLEWLVIVLFFGGLATNLTPCVFPMIPITLRILGRQGQAPWLSSGLYGLGILLTYTALGAVAGLTGGLFGAFMASTVVNVAFAVMFAVLGLSMLGYGQFSWAQNVGNKFGSGRTSAANTLLMGAGAGLVAAPCTGPILGALLAYTAQMQDPWAAIFLFFIYSLGFALPYVFLGSFAGKASKWQVSPKVQVGVKLLFAAAMFGLVFYYLRIPFYRELQHFAGFWGALSLGFGFVGLLFCAAYLIKLPPGKLWAVGPAVCLGIGIFAFSQWSTGGDRTSDIELNWHQSVDTAVVQGLREGKPILVDGWAEWCEACKKMDGTTYLDANIRQYLQQNWIIVKLDFTEMNNDQVALSEKYGMQGLPVTLLLPPNGDLARQRKLIGYVSAEELLHALESFQER
jgi:thioredoxin:protein disulfide reductase